MLTATQLNALKPKEKVYRVYDTGGLPGLYVEVSPKGKKSFRLKYPFAGKEKKLSLGSYPALSISEARKKGEAAKLLVAQGVDPVEEAKRLVVAAEANVHLKQYPDFGSVMDAYCVNESVHHKGHRWNKIRLEKTKRDCSVLCAKRIQDIEPLDIIQWRDQRLTEVSGASVHREANLLSSVFTYAVQELRLIKHNPVFDVKKPKKSKPRVRRISAEEIKTICAACSYEQGTTPRTKTQMVAWCFLFAIETAMRASEITGMTWDNVKSDHVHLPDSKNGSSRDVALLQSAVDLLRLVRGLDDERVILIDAPSLSTLFRKSRDSTYLKDTDLNFHDSRHEACTRLAQILPIQDLAKVSGHKDLKILLNTYYNITASEIAEKMRKNGAER